MTSTWPVDASPWPVIPTAQRVRPPDAARMPAATAGHLAAHLNRHVLVSAVTATGTASISDYYLSWHLLLRSVAFEQRPAAPGRGVPPQHHHRHRDGLRRHRPHPARTARRVVRVRPMTRAPHETRTLMPFRDRAVWANRPGSRSSATQRRSVRLDDSSFTLNTPAKKEQDMPEAMLPAIVAAVCSERGRSERADARVEHAAIYRDVDGVAGGRARRGASGQLGASSDWRQLGCRSPSRTAREWPQATGGPAAVVLGAR